MATLRAPIPGTEYPGEQMKPGLSRNPYAMTNTGALGIPAMKNTLGDNPYAMTNTGTLATSRPPTQTGPMPAQSSPGPLSQVGTAASHTGGTGQYGINWGNVVTDPAEQQRILGLATDAVNRNEAGSGMGGNSYAPGNSREDAIRQAAYGFFPSFGGGGGGMMGGSGVPGGGTGAGGGTGSQFGGSAPTPTPYGNFTAPNPADVANDPYYQFRVAEGQRGLEHSAAARGTLLGGGTLKSLERFRQGLASEEAGKAFDRATTAYGLNRGTNQQNFGQQIDAFGANTNAALGYGRLGLDADELAWRKQQAEQNRIADTNASLVAPAPGLSEYASMIAQQRTPSGSLSALNRVNPSIFGPGNVIASGGLPSRVPGAARFSGARR